MFAKLFLARLCFLLTWSEYDKRVYRERFTNTIIWKIYLEEHQKDTAVGSLTVVKPDINSRNLQDISWNPV